MDVLFGGSRPQPPNHHERPADSWARGWQLNTRLPLEFFLQPLHSRMPHKSPLKTRQEALQPFRGLLWMDELRHHFEPMDHPHYVSESLTVGGGVRGWLLGILSYAEARGGTRAQHPGQCAGQVHLQRQNLGNRIGRVLMLCVLGFYFLGYRVDLNPGVVHSPQKDNFWGLSLSWGGKVEPGCVPFSRTH